MKVLILVAIPLIFFAQDNYEFGPSIMVNDDLPGTHFRATTQRSIACRDDTVYLIWRDDRDGNPQIFFSKSTDAGATWSNNVMVSQGWDTTNCFLPHLALDAGDNIHVAYCAKSENDNDRDIYFTKSTDDGVSFSEPIMVNDSAVVKGQTNCALAVDAAGQNMYVVWQDTRNPQFDEDIYLARSTDGGVSFLPAVRVNDDYGYARQWFPVITCDNSGQNLYIAWMDFRDILHGAGVYFCRSTDNGQTFDSNYRVNDTISTAGWPSICYRNGIIYCAWRDGRDNYAVYFAKSTNGGLSFGPNVRVPDDPGASAYVPSIAADESGKIYIAWEDSRTSGSTGFDIYFSYSDDGGVTFPPNVRVNDLLGITSAWDMRPAIAVNQTATVFVAWDSDRDSPSGACNDIYFASGELTGIQETQKPYANASHIEIAPTIFKNSVVIKPQDLDKKSFEIKIYDITGKLVKQFDPGIIQQCGQIHWGGKNDMGWEVPVGSYFIVVFMDDEIVDIRKVIKIR